MTRKIKFLFLAILLISAWNAMAGKEKSELIFSHKMHVMENEMECSACHAEAESSMKGTDNLMPTMESCGNCHDIESTEECGICHSDTENPRNVPRVDNYFPNFSHRMHLEAEMNCDHCHAGIVNKDYVEPYLLPQMEDCQNCHTQRKVKPKSHLPNYQHTHGDAVRAGNLQQTCNMCHKVRYCQMCHEGDNLDRLTHPLNYGVTHSLDARGRERDCNVCHTERAFCIECHILNLVMPHNHYAGWANSIPGDGGRHAMEARMDLENCLSCHEQNYELTCVKCHSK